MNDEYNNAYLIKIATYNKKIAFYNIKEEMITYEHTTETELNVEKSFSVLDEYIFSKSGNRIIAIMKKEKWKYGYLLIYIDEYSNHLDWTIFNKKEMDEELISDYTIPNFDVLDNL